MPTTLEIIRGIAQAAANAPDGSHLDSLSADGDTRVVGLKREEGNPLIDERVVDGFGIKFHGNVLCITYSSELKLKDVYSQNLENEVSGMIKDIAKFLKKEYKKVTKNTLSLTPHDETYVRVEHISRVRVQVMAIGYYKIGGMDDVGNTYDGQDSPPGSSPEGWRKFIEQGGWDGSGAGWRAPSKKK